MDEKTGQKRAVVVWNQLQFTSVSIERIEEVFRAPKVATKEKYVKSEQWSHGTSCSLQAIRNRLL